jgi:hypothetical protein
MCESLSTKGTISEKCAKQACQLCSAHDGDVQVPNILDSSTVHIAGHPACTKKAHIIGKPFLQLRCLTGVPMHEADSIGHAHSKFFPYLPYLAISPPCSVSRQVRSLFQSEFSRVLPSDFAFNLQYPHVSLRFSSCLHLLPRLPIHTIPPSLFQKAVPNTRCNQSS